MNRPLPSPPAHSSGFTLIEMLVALTLFALLSVMLLGGLRFGTRATSAGTAQQEWSAEIATSANFLRNQLADAQPIDIGGDPAQPAIAFDGSADSVEFVGLPPAHLALGGLHKFTVTVEKNDAGVRQLVVIWRLIRSDGTSTTLSAPHRSVLLDHVAAVEFSYFGGSTSDATPDWHDTWNDMPQLPLLIRLRIAFADGRRAPDMIVALRTAVASQ
jgi:general secretion pathway protein J